MKHSEISDNAPHVQKPIWKSVGFWLGLFVTVSLVWLFAQSASFESSLGHASPTEVWAIGMNEASVQIRRVDTSDGEHVLPVGWQVRRTRVTDLGLEQVSLPLAGKWKFCAVEEHWGWEFTTYVSIPLWFIITLWVALWLTAMNWWRRRQRSRLETMGP